MSLMDTPLSRRDVVRLLGATAPALWLARPAVAEARPASLPSAPAAPDERFWSSVREHFPMPKDLAVMNAANLCPSSLPVLDALDRATHEMDRQPSPAFREEMHEAKEVTRRLLAGFLRVSPEEIVLTRNTSESNNLVSSGLDLRAGDEVLLFSDNHPSNDDAWKEKARRFGYAVKAVPAVSPHPGAEYYVDAFTRALTARTRVLAFTHLTSTVGDLFPARELCRIARERGILTLVDGAQSFGLLDVNLREMDPDFYTGSAHKWPCGPKEAGVLFINRRSQERIWPSLYSAYPGATGISKTFESFGQRDEPAIRAFGEALQLQTRVGREAIERRGQELAQALMAGLSALDGVKLWTHADPARSAAVVSFDPGGLDPDKLALALYEKDRIVCAKRPGADRGGIRLSPHFYNSHAEVERAVGAIKRYLATGV
ncbi:MAG TPA: aminotransferase class V-fold PLP-dependent enzyme [Vicinamibacteria bacterium]|nr:aminotransferase class V-fold PLP-dependent enzyme [Vicinamibacteria bacterium]